MEAFRNRRIVLIGGAGFIGHNLAIALANLGAEVSVIDNLQVNNLVSFANIIPNLQYRSSYIRMLHQRLDLMHENNIKLYVHDARDYALLTHALYRQIKPQVIIHLAAVAHAGKSNKDPFSTFDHSLRTLENALDCARGLETLERFIFFSSSMAYGNFLQESVDEDHPLNPLGIYGALKVAGEKIVIAYNQVFDLPYTIVRPSALYGPRCVSRRVGQIFVESALQGEKLQISGDGTEKLDFTHIDDLIEGVRLIIEKPEAKNQIFNITYGQARSINELLDIVLKHFPKAEVERTERDKLLPFRGTLSIDKARRLLGYEPQNPIDIGVPKYIQWYKDFHAA